MSAHLNITSNIATVYGVTIPEGSKADDCSKTQSVTLDELLESDTNEVGDVDAQNTVVTETSVSGDGPIGLTITPGEVVAPGDLVLLSVDLSEAPNGRCKFTAGTSGSAAFSDPAATVGDVGDEPTVGDLKITSVDYSIAESVSRTSSVSDMVLMGSDGTPAARATTKRERTFSISGRGDLPAGVALGTGGAAFAGGDTGKVMTTTLTTGEKRGDWNRWGNDGSHFLAA